MLFSLLVLVGCVDVHPRPAPLEPVWTDYLREIEKFRRAKDVFFQSEKSPLAARSCGSFSGLRYYPPAAPYRVVGILQRYKTAALRLPADGDKTPMNAVALFHFTMSGKKQALEVWQAGDSAELTVLFTDLTNGRETYEAGRYAILEKAENGMYILDFNYAYNPYCHYNHDFICPLPPPANRLNAPVRAGEKLYHKTVAEGRP